VEPEADPAGKRRPYLGLGPPPGGSSLRGISRAELERAGAYRVYADPADLLQHIDEIGIIDAD
jgi:hypothetical protein